MRNLKRALSLGLTAAMISGLMVMGSSAASSSYTDVADTNNVEAIEVLKAVGVMVGDENGNFNPDQNVTRNEMAVIMANLMEYNVATYKDTSPFTDVPSWAEPYVAACWTNGITAGYSDTIYGGSDTVTTAQAALMLMKALGYFQYASDFGQEWQLATLKQGNNIDLFVGVDSRAEDPLTRNDVAQLVLNTLKAGTVTASTSSNITIGDITIASDVEYNYVTSNQSYATAISDLEPSSSTSSTVGSIVELGERLYQGDLRKTEGTTDDFGRPATEWRYNTSTIGTFGDAPTATWTDRVDKDELYDAVTRSVVDDLESGDWTMDYYVDGVRTAVDEDDISSYIDRNSSEKINDGQDTGNGSLTELYVDDDEDKVTVVVIYTYVFQATEDYNESSEDVNVAAAGDTEISLDSYDLDGDDFNIQDVVEDDYLLITASHTSSSSRYEVQSVAIAELVTGEVTAYGAGDDVTIDGTTYSYAITTNSDGVKDEITSTGGQTTLVLDQYGYIIAVDDTVVGGNYAFIADTDTSLGNAVDAYAYFSDGSYGAISLRRVAGSSSSSTMAAAAGWYTYSVNSSSQYTLTEVSGSYETVDNLNNNHQGADDYADQQILSNGSATLPIDLGGETVRANERTVFVIVDTDGDVSTYTGVSNAPDIVVAEGNDEPIEIGYVYRDNNNNYASYVFISVEDANANVDSSTEDDTYIFLLDQDSQRDDGDESYYVYNAILDGTETEVETDGTYDSMKLYTKVRADSSTDRITDMYELDVERTDGTWAKIDLTGDETVSYSNGVLIIGDNSFIVNDDSRLNMILDYSERGDEDEGVYEIMSDKGSDYEVYSNVSGSSLRSTLSGYEIGGYYYIVTEDDNEYSGNGGSNSTLDYLYLYIDEADYVGTSSGGSDPTVDTDGTETVISNGTVYAKLIDTTASNGTVQAEVLTALRAEGYTSINTTSVVGTANGINQNGGVVTAIDPNGDTVSFNVLYTNLWTVTVDGTVRAYLESGSASDTYTIAANSLDDGNGDGYLVNGSSYKPYEDAYTFSAVTSAQTVESGYISIPTSVTGATLSNTDGYMAYNENVTITVNVDSDDVTSNAVEVILLADDETIDSEIVEQGATGDDLTVVFTYSGSNGSVTTFSVDIEDVREVVTLSDPIVTNNSGALNVSATYVGDTTDVKEGDTVTIQVTVTGTAGSSGSTLTVSGVTSGNWITSNLPTSASESSGIITITADAIFSSSGTTFEYEFVADASGNAPTITVDDIV